ncbi:MAG: agmatine deiminase family protein, partial [Bacteroidales bacterium]|nr:agmatine deiminase family protein [Bacteroidales bacterium]
MKKALIALTCLLVSGTTLTAQQAQTDAKQRRAQLLEQVNNMSEQQISDYISKHYMRVPAKKDKSRFETKALPQAKATGVKSLGVPEDAIFPIESDEVQAILMTWPYYAVTESGQQAEMFFEGLGTTEYYPSKLEAVTSVPFVQQGNSQVELFANLADGIQKHAQVWMVLHHEDDTATIKEYMEKRGTPLTNCRFFIYPTNAFWFRDFGPMAFYYGDDDQIGFVDLEYYGGRPLDDEVPIKIAKEMGYPVYTTGIEYEGGNILMDGLGQLFTSSAVYGNNQDSYGQMYLNADSTVGYYTKKPLTEQQVKDSLTDMFNLTDITVMPKFQYDGGTGHIDLYADMWEETGFVVSQFPEDLASWTDAKTAVKNIETMKSKEDYFGENFATVSIPFPRMNNGKWYASQSSYNQNYTRSYSNHTFVNDAIVQPVFYDTTKSGSQKGDVESNRQALNVMKLAYPGYHFEEIDVRSFDGYGGAIHCITKQIPAENPVRIYHQPVRWFNTADNGTVYNVEVLSQNKSGIESVKIKYRNTDINWFETLELAPQGDNLFTGKIELKSDKERDTLFYYIES